MSNDRTRTAAHTETQLAEHFRSFHASAFRLEMRSEYAVEDEAEEYQRFLDGAERPDTPSDELEPWLSMVRAHVEAGREMQRVHLVGAMTPYLYYEIEWRYPFAAATGEEICILRSIDACPSARTVSLLQDFWFFDRETCILMDYDVDGRFLGGVALAPSLVPQYAQLTGELLTASAPLGEFQR